MNAETLAMEVEAEGWSQVDPAAAGSTSEGLVTAIEAVARELHQYRQAQNELQRSHELFLGVFEGTTDAVFVKDLGGRYLMANRAGAMMLARPVHEILGRDDFELFPQAEARRLRRADRLIMSLAATKTYEEVLQVSEDTERRFYLITEGPYRDGSGNIVGVFAIARDITERKQAEHERSVLVHELEESVRSRDDFLAIASHELKTPLAALRLHLENTRRLAARKVQTAEEREAWLGLRLEQAERQVDFLTRQVGTMLDVTRVTSGRLELQCEQTDVVALVHDVLGRFAEEVETCGTTLVTRLPMSLTAYLDRTRMEQVLTNLVSNALKYGGGGRIDIRLARCGDVIRLSVQDHGQGIPREFRSRIFERFERAVPNSKIPGSGLGLWILREIVEAHGGHVRVSSRPGKGSRFTVLLPA